MNPEEKRLLERTLKLSEENHELLKKIDRRAKRAAIYGFIKLAIIVLPLVIGYFLLEPYINQGIETYSSVLELLK